MVSTKILILKIQEDFILEKLYISWGLQCMLQSLKQVHVSGSFQPAVARKYLFLEVLSVYALMSKILQAVYLKFETLLGTSSFLMSFVSQQILGTKNYSLG